jgi:periplasmic protein TonB
MPSGGMAVSPGSPEGTATGRPGGTGRGQGGGGLPGSAGSGPAVVPLSSVAVMPEAIGEHDLSKDYPEAARRQGVEGQVVIRLLVDDSGRVAQTRLVRGPGHGLDAKALELARRIRFKPARDDRGTAVATWITWTFSFTLPR